MQDLKIYSPLSAAILGTLWRITPPRDCRSSGGFTRSTRLPPDAEVLTARSQFPKSKSKPLEAEVVAEVEVAQCRSRSPIPNFLGPAPRKKASLLGFTAKVT